ncbi:MAG TPA: hypothetical protein VGF45_22485 [Polyangia bacterium]
MSGRSRLGRRALGWIGVGLLACFQGCHYEPPEAKFACGLPDKRCPRGLSCDLAHGLCCSNGMCAANPGGALGAGSLELTDGHLEEADVTAECIGGLCLSGGITP